MKTDQTKYGINALVRPGQEALLAKCKEAGIQWIRINIDWKSVQPDRAERHWSAIDAFIRTASQLKLSVFASISYTPKWANGNQAKEWPPTNGDIWYAFVREAVARFKMTVKHWGIWNEPNLQSFYRGTKQQYIQNILLPGIKAIRDEDSGAMIVGPELSHQDKNWKEWLKYTAKHIISDISIVSHHIYKDPSDTWRGLFSYLDGVPISDNRPCLRDVLKQLKISKRVWITEVGWRSDKIGEREQAKKYTDMLAGLAKRDWIEKVFFYELVEDSAAKEKFGILGPKGGEKKAYEAYSNWIKTSGPTRRRRLTCDRRRGPRSSRR